jgi:hypothetical protein
MSFMVQALLVFALGSLTQASAETADALLQAQKWSEAAAAYEELVKGSPDSPQFRLRLGVALARLNRDPEALQHLQRAKELGAAPVPVALQLALVHGRAGALDHAFRELTYAASMGLSVVPPQFDTEPGIDKLRADPRYREFLAAVDRNSRPCEHDPKYRALDFWVGEWEVRGVNALPGTPSATSSITKIHKGCVILETYGAGSTTGQSFNIYDRSTGKWRQTWVDSSGRLHEYWGEATDGMLVYEGSLPPLPGQTGRQQTRMTFSRLDPDRVRQYSERSPDGGKTWQINFDLVYTRRK